jgi:hypothetical protein
MEVSGQLHDPAAFSTGIGPLVPLDSKMGVPQSLSGHGSQVKNSQPLPGLETRIIQYVALL